MKMSEIVVLVFVSASVWCVMLKVIFAPLGGERGVLYCMVSIGFFIIGKVF